MMRLVTDAMEKVTLYCQKLFRAEPLGGGEPGWRVGWGHCGGGNHCVWATVKGDHCGRDH